MLALPRQSATERGEDWFLPDFCRLPVIFVAVLGAQLCAFALVLAVPRSDVWLQLSRTSLFIEWIVLLGTASLCLLGRHLRRLGPRLGALAAYLTVLVVAGLCSAAACWIMEPQFWLQDVTQHDAASFVMRNLTVTGILSALLLRYAYVQHQWQQRVRSEARARFDALQARIRPHFLFNCMNTIATLTRTRPEQAETVVENLAALFRASLTDTAGDSTVGDELELTRRYLQIERQRLGARLRVHWSVDAIANDAPLPALTLQPLVENAVYHGIETQTAGGTIRIAVRDMGEEIVFRLANGVPELGSGHPRPGNGMALDNVRGRLQAFFDGAATLTVERAARQYRITVRVPRRAAPAAMSTG